jgi:hypothetical protein
MKLDRIKETAYLFSVMLLTLFMLIIIFYTFGNLDYADYLATFMKSYSIPVYLFTGAIFIFAFVHIAGIQITNCNPKQMRRAAIVIGLIIIAIQVMVIYFIRSPLRSDPGMVFDQALDMFTTKTVSPTAIENYFAIYPNNIPLCIFEHLLLKLGSWMGLKYEYYLFYLDLINVLLIDLAMCFTYQIIKMLHSETLAVKFLLLCALNPLLYAYSILVYTSTLSMPFIMGAIYFFLRASREKKAIKRIVYTIATILIMYFGYRLRVTLVITIIAMLIYMILQKKEKITKEAIIRNGKTVIIITITFVLANGIYQSVENKYVAFDYSKTGLPVTHWLMMGAQGSGGFNVEDFNYTLSFSTKEERVKANLEEYKRRIHNLGLDGTFRLILNKLRVTWSDGLDATIDSLSDNKTYYSINDYLTGSKKDIYVSYCHMYNLMLMLLLFVSVLQGLHRKLNHPIIIIYLNLLGGIIFHLLWETGAAYNICFTFLILLLANDGQEIISNHVNDNKLRKLSIGVCSIGMISTVILLAAGYHNMVEIPFKQYPIAANQDFHENECPALFEGDELVQTFVTSRAFNRIGIKVRNFTQDANQSFYTVQLLDENDNVIVSNEVVGSLAFDTDYYRIPIDTIVPEKATRYKLKIITKKADETNNIVFMVYNTGNWNIYEDGKLFINGEEVRGSLTFSVFESVEKSFFSTKQYKVLAGLIVIMEALLIIILTLLFRKPQKVAFASVEKKI